MLINTFNVHEEHIVETYEDAIKASKVFRLMILNNEIFENKNN